VNAYAGPRQARHRSRFVLAYGWLISLIGWAAFVGWEVSEHGEWFEQVGFAVAYVILFTSWRGLLNHYRWLSERGQLQRVHIIEWALLGVAFVALTFAWVAVL